jgi:hypothetical protein
MDITDVVFSIDSALNMVFGFLLMCHVFLAFTKGLLGFALDVLLSLFTASYGILTFYDFFYSEGDNGRYFAFLYLAIAIGAVFNCLLHFRRVLDSRQKES